MAPLWPAGGWQSPVVLLAGFGLLVVLEIALHRFHLSQDNPLIASYPTRQMPDSSAALHWPLAGMLKRTQAGTAVPAQPLAASDRKESEIEVVARRVAGEDRSLIFVTASKTFIDFLENWVASVAKFGKEDKVLFIAEDEVAYAHMKRRWPTQTVMVSLEDLHLEKEITGSSSQANVNATFSTPYYKALVDRRPEYFKLLLDLDISVLFNDIDMVWLGDPFEYFTGDYDIWVQEDGKVLDLERFNNSKHAKPLPGGDHQLCTCFMYIRPTPASKKLIYAWSQGLRDEIKKAKGGVLDNFAFYAALRRMDEKEIKVQVLPIVNFPSGFLFFECPVQQIPACSRHPEHQKKYKEMVRTEQVKPVVIHNNWIRGRDNKVKRFKEFGFWFLTEEAEAAATQVAKQK